MDKDLQRYLNDHLAGSQSALVLIQDLAERQEDPQERHFFCDLKRMVEGDQALLRKLLSSIGQDESQLLQVAGNLTGKASRLKLIWEGMRPGRLGMFEALEMLTLGIQGKRLLWVVLREIAPHFPEWDGIDFATLELDAIGQRNSVEQRRLLHGRETLASTVRRTAKAPAA